MEIELEEFEIEEFEKEWEVDTGNMHIEIGCAEVSYLNPFFEICLADPNHPCHHPFSCRSCEECPHKYLCDRGEYVTTYLKAVRINGVIYLNLNDYDLMRDIKTQKALKTLKEASGI